jgi:hypothetical protein
MKDAQVDDFVSYPSSFQRALLAYPTLFVGLSATLGLYEPAKVRDRRHWRDAAQNALKLVSSVHAILTSVLAARDVFDRKWTQ